MYSLRAEPQVTFVRGSITLDLCRSNNHQVAYSNKLLSVAMNAPVFPVLSLSCKVFWADAHK